MFNKFLYSLYEKKTRAKFHCSNNETTTNKSVQLLNREENKQSNKQILIFLFCLFV